MRQGSDYSAPERGPYFATQLRAVEQQAVLDAEPLLKELVEHPGWKFVASLIEARADSLHRSTLAVDAKDHLSYVVHAAEERVLRAVLDAPKDAVSTARWVDDQRRLQLERREALMGAGGGRRQ